MASKMADEDEYGARRPPEKVGLIKTLYDSDKGTVLGRTPSNWGELIIFYSVFYIVLAIMFSICLYGLLSSCSPDRPKYTLQGSLIGSNPGLGYRPYPDEISDKGSVIWYKASDPGNVQKWTMSLDRFLSDYTNRSIEGYENRVSCDADTPAPPGKVCNVDVAGPRFGPCTSDKQYSYNQSSPCIFVKLNRLFDWVPEYYTKDNIPDDMSEDLKRKVATSNEKLVWIECGGVHSYDKENIGPIEYYPRQGFASFYYPYTNTKGYVSPVVAVHLKRPQVRVFISIECRAWAQNIKYERSKQHAEGSVRFELMIDD